MCLRSPSRRGGLSIQRVCLGSGNWTGLKPQEYRPSRTDTSGWSSRSVGLSDGSPEGLGPQIGRRIGLVSGVFCRSRMVSRIGRRGGMVLRVNSFTICCVFVYFDV